MGSVFIRNTPNTPWVKKSIVFFIYDILIKLPVLYFKGMFFKDCKFILQTRSLFDWMVSRVNQGSYNYLIGLKSKEIDDEVMFRWIEDRNYWYNRVHEYF